VRAFLVNGLAPSEFADVDGDGRMTAADARLIGYDVISNEETVRLREVSGIQCGGEPFTNLIPFDFYNKRAVRTDIVCPQEPGAIEPPPQWVRRRSPTGPLRRLSRRTGPPRNYRGGSNAKGCE